MNWKKLMFGDNDDTAYQAAKEKDRSDELNRKKQKDEEKIKELMSHLPEFKIVDDNGQYLLIQSDAVFRILNRNNRTGISFDPVEDSVNEFCQSHFDNVGWPADNMPPTLVKLNWYLVSHGLHMRIRTSYSNQTMSNRSIVGTKGPELFTPKQDGESEQPTSTTL